MATLEAHFDGIKVRQGNLPVAETGLERTGIPLLFIPAWSAGIEPPYQQARILALSELLDSPVIMPNTPGQGVGSPDLTRDQRSEVRAGRMGIIGRFVGRTALSSLTDVRSVKIGAISQGPALAPGVLEVCAQHEAEVDDVTLITPASTNNSAHRLGLAMALTGGRDMNHYRLRNPSSMQGHRDTNLVRSLLGQPSAHIIDYPMGMARQNLTRQMATALGMFGRPPSVKVVSAEFDKVSDADANQSLVADLQYEGFRAEHHFIADAHHAISEDTPLMAHYISKTV